MSHPHSITGPNNMEIERQCRHTYFLGNWKT